MGDKSAVRGFPGGWSHDGSGIDTTPCYVRPDEAGVGRAKQRAFRVAECIVSQAVIIDSALIRLVIGGENAVTVAEAMWAIHELTTSGGFVAMVKPFATENVCLVTDANPPAGLSVAAGPLHMVGNNSHWGVLWFSINHERMNQLQATTNTPARRQPTARESTVLIAIGDGELTGSEIAERAGFKNNSRFRELLSTMVKLDLLKKGFYGYYAASRDMSRDKE